MAWVILIASGVLEAVWATALGKSDGFSKFIPSLVFFISLALSMWGLSVAVKTIPTGTAYAIWVGIGATLTMTYAMATGTETASIAKIALILGIVACVVGLKMLHD